MYIPANIAVSLTTSIRIRTSTLVNRNSCTVKIGGTTVIDQTGPEGTIVTETYTNLQANGTLTTANIRVEYTSKMWSGTSCVWLDSATLLYR